MYLHITPSDVSGSCRNIPKRDNVHNNNHNKEKHEATIFWWRQKLELIRSAIWEALILLQQAQLCGQHYAVA